MITISNAEFDRAVQQALDEIPGEFRQYLENLVIEVHRRPDPALLKECDETDDLLGLYVGVPLEEKGVEGGLGMPLPDRVLLFRDNLCELCETREELIEEIRVTVLHEIGHHFGLDEQGLEEVGYD